MVSRVLLIVIVSFAASFKVCAAALTFDWKGSSSSTWEASTSWTETGATGDYPGSGGRTTDIVRFGVTGSSYTKQPTLITAITIASIEFGGAIQSAGTKLTVTGVTLTVGTITQDINTSGSNNTVFDYLQGTGTVSATTITVGSGTGTNGSFNFLMADVATLNVSGNVIIKSNVNKQNGCGFRLESGDMYLSGQIVFTQLSGISASTQNASYFTINTVTQATGAATTPHLYLSNPTPITTIPTPNASVNFYGDHGGTSTVTYTAASPSITTTSTGGFGSGGANIDTSKASYDYLTINASGTATVGGSTLGALKVAGDLTTSSPTTFNTTGGTNTSVGGNWSNSSTITEGTGTTAVSGNITNSGTMNLSTGILEVGGNVSNTAAINAGAGNITIDGSLSTSSNLTLSTGDLTVGGNYTNSAGGVFTAGSGTVYFNGASAETLTDNSTGGTVLNNVDFKGGGTKTLTGSGSFSVSGIGVLTMEASTQLKTGNILTLVSTATGTASVAGIPSTASITGLVNVQRYISGGSNTYRGYRFLSSPVYTASVGSSHYWDLSYLPLYAPITGTLGTLGGLTKSGNPSMYLYRGNVAYTNKTFNTGNFRGINKINNLLPYVIGVDFDLGIYNLTPGTGILFFYRGNLTNIANKYTTTTSAEPNTFSSTGTLNQQAVKFINWYTGIDSLQFTPVAGNATSYVGYNLVGNPYACSIDWTTHSSSVTTAGIYAPNVGNTIYIYNETTKLYATFDGTTGINGGNKIIPSGQGFFVKATGLHAALTFNEAAKVIAQLTGPTTATGASDLLLDAMPLPAVAAAVTGPKILRLELDADSINKAETVIRLDQTANNKYVENEDSQYFVGNGIIGFSSITGDGYGTAINVIPYPNKSEAVKLDVTATGSGRYTLNMTEMQNIPPIFDVWLMDNYRKDSLDIKRNPTYAFNIDLTDTNTFGKNRFQIVIRQNPALGVHLLNFTATKVSAGANTVWKTENEDSYTNFTVERSTDKGVTYDVLGGLTSASLGSYNFLDKTPATGANMYRLKIEDLNGTITYSKIITLTYGSQNNPASTAAVSNINVYPNPAVGTINLSINTPSLSSGVPPLQTAGTTGTTGTNNAAALTYGIKIITLTGSVIKTATSDTPAWQDNISSLTPGTYLIEVVNNNDKSVVGKSKFVKL